MTRRIRHAVAAAAVILSTATPIVDAADQQKNSFFDVSDLSEEKVSFCFGFSIVAD